MAAKAKASLVAFVSNALGEDSSLARTYRQMGWQEFVRTPHPDLDAIDLAGLFVAHLCLDEDGFYNDFAHPLTSILPPFLAEQGFQFPMANAPRLYQLLTSGDVTAGSISALLR